MSRRSRSRIIVIVGVLAVLAVVGFGPFIVQHFTKTTTTPPLATAAVQSFPVTVTASGTLLPQSLVNINFPIAGVVARVNVAPGESVVAGQSLAQLNDSTQQAELQAAQQALTSAEEVLSALESSHGNAIEILNARAQIASANAALEHARAEEALTIVTAPEAGTVLEINSAVGEGVSAGETTSPTIAGSSDSISDPTSTADAFMVIGNSTAFQVSTLFSQEAATRLATGQTGTVTFDALPGLTFPCHVEAIATSATSVNGVPEYYAAIIPVGTNAHLKSGMTANVTVTVAQAKDVLAVPSQALYFGTSGTYVSVWYKGKSVPTAVTTGLIGNDLTEVTAGLASGEQVVLTAPVTLPTPTPGTSTTSQ
jgi:macrolide-specific efflux system membrane fusion protein